MTSDGSRAQDLEKRLEAAEASLRQIRQALVDAGEKAPDGCDKLAAAVADVAGRSREGRTHGQLISQFSTIPHVVFDAEGKFVEVNDAFCRTFGYEAEEVIGKMRGGDVTHPDDRERFAENWEHIVNGEVDHYQAQRRYVRKNGEILHADVTVVALRDAAGQLRQAFAHLYDRTRQEQILEALRDSENRLRVATDAAGIGIWEFDVEKDLLIWNNEMFRIYGIDRNMFSGHVSAWRKSVHPEDYDDAVKALEDALADRREFHTQFRILRPDGELRYIQAHARVDWDEQEQPRKMFGVNLDLTDARQAAETLEKEERFSRRITEICPAGIAIWDCRENRVSYCNEEYEKIVGYSLEELRSQGTDLLEKLYHPDSTDMLRDHDEALLNDRSGEVFEMLYHVVHKSGRDVWALSRETVLSRKDDGLPAEVLGIGIDITKQRKIQQQLIQQEQAGRALVEEGQALVSATTEELDEAIHHLLQRVGEISDADRSYVFLFDEENQTMSNSHEWSAEGIEPQIENLQDLPIAAAPNLSRQMFARENVVIPDVASLPDDWEEERTVLSAQDIVSAMMIPLVSGKQVIGFAGFDAVRSKRLWSEDYLSLLSIMGDLIASVVQRRRADEENSQLMQELVSAKEHAEAASRAKDEFLAVMSHELRTPLNPILGFTEILQENCEDDEEREYLDTILQCAQRQLKMINSILSYSRLDKMSVKPEWQEVTLLPVFREAMSEIQPLSHGLATRLENGLPDEGWDALPEDLQAVLDPFMLRQLLDNLLSNACKYTKEGRITLQVGIAPGQAGKPGALCFAVEDTGIGIPETNRQRLFDPFTQVDSSHSREYEGAGLGLAICRKLCETLDGEIDFTSAPGEGSRFWVKLPLKLCGTQRDREVSEGSTRAPSARKLASDCQVLIVDDRADNAFLLSTLIRKLGGNPQIASTGAQALEMAESMVYKVILMDLSMPGMDGFETAARIREIAKSHRDIPIIAISADVSAGIRERCAEAGMTGFLPKPVSGEALFKTLEKACGRPAQ